MPQFTRSSCVAFTWNDDGDCRGVLLKRSGNQCSVAKAWKAHIDSKSSVAEKLSEGSRELDVSKASFCMASGLGDGWDMVDVTMPKLPAEQLRNALSFELRKHTPLSPEHLRWGYRVLPSDNSPSSKLSVRLVFLKATKWDQWQAHVSSIGMLDLMMPPPAALDPLFSGKTVTFPGKTPQDSFSYTPVDGTRQAVPASFEDLSKPLDQLIPSDTPISFDALDEYPPEEQQSFSAAIILALYGLTRQASSDTATMLPVPAELKPHRNVVMAVLASVLASAILLSFCTYGVILLQSRSSEIRRLEKELKSIKNEVEAVKKIAKNDKTKVLAELKKEIINVTTDTPPLPLVMAELSRIIPSPAWLSGNFSWDEGMIKFTLEEPVTDPTLPPAIDSQDLIDALEDSPYIGDVRGLKSNLDVRNNKRTRDFDMQARFDTPEEFAAASARNAERKQAARRKQEEEMKAQEELQKEERASDENEGENARPRASRLQEYRSLTPVRSNQDTSSETAFPRKNKNKQKKSSQDRPEDGEQPENTPENVMMPPPMMPDAPPMDFRPGRPE